MATCEQMQPLVVRAADGALTAAERAALDEHTATCAGCRDAITDQAAVSRMLAEVPLDPAPRGFAARVRAQVEPRPGLLDLLNWQTWTWRLAPVAALLGLIVWLPSSGDTSFTLSAAEQAWVSGGSDASQALPSAFLYSDELDGYDLLAVAVEAQQQ